METKNKIQKLVLVALVMIGTFTQIGCGEFFSIEPEFYCDPDDTQMTQLETTIIEVSPDVIIDVQSDARLSGSGKTLNISIGGYGSNLYHGRNFLIGDFNDVNETIAVAVDNEIAFTEETQVWTGTISATLISTAEIPDTDQPYVNFEVTATERKFEFFVDLQSETSTIKYHGTTTLVQGMQCFNANEF